MHVRVAPEALSGRLILGLLAWCCLLIGCSRTRADVTVNWTLDPPRPSAGGEIVVQLSVRNTDGTPASGVKMQCTAQMSHPGMTPIVSPLVERTPGRYETRLHVSMAGDWVLVAAGELPNGHRIQSSYRVVVP